MLWNPMWETDTATLILCTADSIMDKHGWCTGAAVNDLGEVCLMGAMTLAAKALSLDIDVHLREAEARVRKYLWERDGYAKDYVTWNDTVCETKEQALGVLRGAANERLG
jgi:hypothetical protein